MPTKMKAKAAKAAPVQEIELDPPQPEKSLLDLVISNGVSPVQEVTVKVCQQELCCGSWDTVSSKRVTTKNGRLQVDPPKSYFNRVTIEHVDG